MRAEVEPPCAVAVLAMTAPLPSSTVQPARPPLSKPPFSTRSPMGGGRTTMVAESTCVPDAAVPLTVKDVVSAAAPVAALTVSVDEAPAVTLVGLKDAVTPVGSPEALRLTDCGLPEVTAVDTVKV